MNWKDLSLIKGEASIEFKEYLDENNLTQLITQPTHAHGNTLDLVITSAPHKVYNLEIREPLSCTCDHNIIEARINQNLNTKHTTSNQKNFYRGNYEEINKEFSNTEWSNILSEDHGLNQAYSNFINTIHSSIEKFVPRKKSKRKVTTPRYIKSLLNLKKKIYQKIRVDPTAKRAYKEIDIVYKKAVLHHNKIQEHVIMNSNNKKAFYNHINKKLKTSTPLPPMFDENSNICIDPEEKANLLNEYFSKVFTPDDNQKPQLFLSKHQNTIKKMPSLDITASMVINATFNLKNSTSRTPDNIPAYFLKKTAKSLSQPLAMLFNRTLKSQKVPDI
jgi:hypothetical protein